MRRLAQIRFGDIVDLPVVQYDQHRGHGGDTVVPGGRGHLIEGGDGPGEVLAFGELTGQAERGADEIVSVRHTVR